jgi:hypothetical protein
VGGHISHADAREGARDIERRLFKKKKITMKSSRLRFIKKWPPYEIGDICLVNSAELIHWLIDRYKLAVIDDPPSSKRPRFFMWFDFQGFINHKPLPNHNMERK